VSDIQDPWERPLGILTFGSDLLVDEEMIATLDGVLNLLHKAENALERGTPVDRDRAAALLDRAEAYLEQRLDPAGLRAEVREHLDGVLDLIRRQRARVAQPAAAELSSEELLPEGSVVEVQGPVAGAERA